jgi:hypothetical protein
MSQTTQERNKALVLDAFDTLFNKRDYEAAQRYWSPTYIQHRRTSSGSRMVSLSNTGTLSRTRRLKSNPGAAGRCSAIRFPCTAKRVVLGGLTASRETLRRRSTEKSRSSFSRVRESA